MYIYIYIYICVCVCVSIYLRVHILHIVCKYLSAKCFEFANVNIFCPYFF